MEWELGNAIEHLLPLEEPVSVSSVDMYRDGGTVDVTLKDARQQSLELYFDSHFGSLGRLYVKVTSTNRINSVAQDSQAEHEIVRWLRQHVDKTTPPKSNSGSPLLTDVVVSPI